MKKSKISSLAELQEEKRRLRLMTKVTKREMSHSLGFMRSETKKVALSNIAIPAGLTAAGGMLLKKIISPDNSSQKTVKAKSAGLTNIIVALIPLAMKFFENQEQAKVE